MLKKLSVLVLALLLASFAFTACKNNQDENKTSEKTESNSQESEKKDSSGTNNEGDKKSSNLGNIVVVSREDGSGTRGAFTEITGILEEKDGEKKDMTSTEAVVQNSTNAVIMTVSNDVNAIGYISLGSLNDKVKAVKIEGVEATAENVQNKSYKISRPFNICYKKDLDDLSKDFIDFILSKQGQDIILEHKYVEAVKDAPEYTSKGLKGKIAVAGSTSVTPVMEKLAEKYKELNEGVEIEIQSSGSSAGIKSAIEGAANIGMASRELKDDEKAKLEHKVIAIDGIAVIVNKDNATEDLTMEKVKEIFTGALKTWSDI